MKLTPIPLLLVTLVTLAGCGGGDHGHSHGPGGSHEDGHDHGPGEDHASEDEASHGEEGGEHEHEETSLGKVTIGDLELELAQGHGALAAGGESHLVVRLPYSDQGETVVRAWVGTEDRFASVVGLGEYEPSHDDYDVHATAPDPLPEGVMWWIEVERPDGSTVLGSAKPLLD